MFFIYDLTVIGGKALLGFEKNVTLLDGSNLLLARKGLVTQPG